MFVKKIQDGASGIAQTVAAILALSHDPRTTSKIRAIALMICNKAGAKTDFLRARALFYWMHSNIVYVRDPTYREFIQPPLNLLHEGLAGTHMAAGDCDDHCTALMALCGSIGIPARVTLIEDSRNKTRSGDPWWAHVYCEVLLKKHQKAQKKYWYAVDSSLKWLSFGERVLGRTTYIYPSDINIDLMLDAARKNGPGFVNEIISKKSNSILRVMRKRTIKGTVKGPIEAGKAASLAMSGVGQLDIVGAVFGKVTGLVSSFFSSSAMKAAAKAQGKAQIAIAQSRERLSKKHMELKHHAEQIGKERQFAVASEAEAFNALVKQQAKERFVMYGVIGIPLLSLVIIRLVRR